MSNCETSLASMAHPLPTKGRVEFCVVGLLATAVQGRWPSLGRGAYGWEIWAVGFDRANNCYVCHVLNASQSSPDAAATATAAAATAPVRPRKT